MSFQHIGGFRSSASAGVGVHSEGMAIAAAVAPLQLATWHPRGPSAAVQTEAGAQQLSNPNWQKAGGLTRNLVVVGQY